MIDLYYWTTPNGHKITMFLEEASLPYQLHTVNIGRGEQFQPEFLTIAPNNRIPAIVDQSPTDGGAPILCLNPAPSCCTWPTRLAALCRRTCVAGQNHHFSQYAPEKLPYAIERYTKETARLYGVLNKHLSDGRDYIAGEYSIADMASYPWIVPFERQGQKLEDFPFLAAWFARVAARPATARAYAIAEGIKNPGMDEAAKKILFGQDASTVR